MIDRDLSSDTSGRVLSRVIGKIMKTGERVDDSGDDSDGRLRDSDPSLSAIVAAIVNRNGRETEVEQHSRSNPLINRVLRALRAENY